MGISRAAALHVVVVSMLSLTPAVAQGAADSWAELVRSGRLRPGDAVAVIDGTGAFSDGVVRSLASDSLTITVGQASRMWAGDDIREIIRRDSKKNGILIGAGIGAATLLGLCRSRATRYYVKPCPHYEGALMHGLTGFFGLGIGGIVGFIADEKMMETLYERSGSVRLAVSPAVSAKGLGARVTVGW